VRATPLQLLRLRRASRSLGTCGRCLPALKKVHSALTQAQTLAEFSEALPADFVYTAKVAEVYQEGVKGP